MGDVETISDLGLFAWGCVGGFIAALLVLTYPWLHDLVETERSRPSLTMALGATGILVLQAFFGGVVALLGGKGSVLGEVTDFHQALAYGLGWPAFMKGIGETGKELLRR